MATTKKPVSSVCSKAGRTLATVCRTKKVAVKTAAPKAAVKKAVAKPAAKPVLKTAAKPVVKSTPDRITLSKLKNFVDDLPAMNNEQKRKNMIKFIKNNSITAKYNQLKSGDKIWLFSNPAQAAFARVIFKELKSSNSDNFITIYFTNDPDFVDLTIEHRKDFAFMDAANVGTKAYDRGGKLKDIYYKSIKKDNEIPLG